MIQIKVAINTAKLVLLYLLFSQLSACGGEMTTTTDVAATTKPDAPSPGGNNNSDPLQSIITTTTEAISDLFKYNKTTMACTNDLGDFGFNENQIVSCGSVSNIDSANLSGFTLQGLQVVNGTVSNSVLSSCDLTGANFSGSLISNADFTNANLTNTQFVNSTVTNSKFSDPLVVEELAENGVNVDSSNQLPATSTLLTGIINQDQSVLSTIVSSTYSNSIVDQILQLQREKTQNLADLGIKRNDYLNLTAARDQKTTEAKQVTESLVNSKTEISNLIRQQNIILADFRAAKESFYNSTNEQEKKEIVTNLLEFKRHRDDVVSRIKSLKQQQTNNLPQAGQVLSEVQDLVSSAKDGFNSLKPYKERNKALAKAQASLLARLSFSTTPTVVTAPATTTTVAAPVAAVTTTTLAAPVVVATTTTIARTVASVTTTTTVAPTPTTTTVAAPVAAVTTTTLAPVAVATTTTLAAPVAVATTTTVARTVASVTPTTTVAPAPTTTTVASSSSCQKNGNGNGNAYGQCNNNSNSGSSNSNSGSSNSNSGSSNSNSGSSNRSNEDDD